jgi:stage V sporulation protein B
MRGVFWGNKDFFPYSLIELLEEICMIIVGIILINNSVSVYDGAISAGIAVIVSYAFSFSLSIFVFIFRKNKLANPYSQFKPLLKSSTPVTIMRTVSTLAMSVVSIILPMRLVVAGFSQAQALSLYGSAVGQAVPLMFIPTSLISSLTLVLIPEISENFYKNNHKNLKNDIEKSIGFTIALTCLFVPVFFVCGKELGVLIFNNADCGEFLSLSSFLVVFIGLVNITTSILNSIGAENQVLFFYMISGVFMILSVWILPKYLGIYSLIIGYVFIYGLTSILNLALIKKKSQKFHFLYLRSMSKTRL